MMDDSQYTEDEQEHIETIKGLPAPVFALADAILKTREEAINARMTCGVEKRWKEDEIALGGLEVDMSKASGLLDYVTGERWIGQKGSSATRSEVIINIIRGKVDTAEGRFGDMMLPVDDKNWGLKTTPVPEMADMLEDERPAMQNGQPVTLGNGQQASMADIAKHKRDKAKKRMKAMEAEIDDQLTECDYNAEQRKGISDAIRLGTMVVKGPQVVKGVRKSYQPITGVDPQTGEEIVVHQLNISEDLKPGSIRVDPWNCYPDPYCGGDIQKASYMWEAGSLIARELRDLIGVEGYEDDQIIKVLEEGPTTVSTKRSRNNEKNSSGLPKEGMPFETWEYNGDVPREFLEYYGYDLSDDIVSKSLMACVVFVNDRPIKVAINPIEASGIPYDFFQWFIVDKDSVWGIGVVRMLIWLQRVITAAWRLMMDNAGDSSGANCVLGEGIEPIDGFWEFTGKKGWKYTGTLDDVRKAFAQFQVQNNQQQLQAIIELALRFVDLETSTPTLFQGEAQTAPETLGATNIMVDANNVALRQRTVRYDDQITAPHISRYYHWNMQHNPKPEIKGDFEVDPRGTSVLLERDSQYQFLLQVFGLKGDPDVDRETDWSKAIQQLYRSRRLDISKSDEDKKKWDEEKAQQPAAANPQLEVAQVRVQGEMQKEELRQNSDMAELEFKANQAAQDREHERLMKEMDVKLKMMEFAEKRGLELDKIKTQLTLAAKNDQAKAPQVATPPTEPPGRAPEGQAYQR